MTCNGPEKRKLQERDNIKVFWFLSFDNRLDNKFEKYVEGSKHHESDFLDNPIERFVTRGYFEVVDYGLEGLYFKVNEGVRIGVVAQTVHLLPLLMSKSTYQPQKSKGMIFHMNKVMSHSNNRIYLKTTHQC